MLPGVGGVGRVEMTVGQGRWGFQSPSGLEAAQYGSLDPEGMQAWSQPSHGGGAWTGTETGEQGPEGASGL